MTSLNYAPASPVRSPRGLRCTGRELRSLETSLKELRQAIRWRRLFGSRTAATNFGLSKTCKHWRIGSLNHEKSAQSLRSRPYGDFPARPRPKGADFTQNPD